MQVLLGVLQAKRWFEKPKIQGRYEVVPAATIWRSFAFIPQINEQAEFSLSLPQGGERAFMDSKDQRDGDRSCLAQHWESQDTTGFCSTAVACLLLKHTLLCLLM